MSTMETMYILISLVVVVAVIIWLKCQHRTATRRPSSAWMYEVHNSARFEPIRYVRIQGDWVRVTYQASKMPALDDDHEVRAVVGNIRPGIYNPNPPPPRPPEA